MTPLAVRLSRRIAEQGPIPLSEFMAAALADPAHGYYMRGDPFGVRGDFVTAPEVSQMFGELLGVWCVAVWERLGAPAPFALVELGPGRGSLMADLLRAAAIRPAFLRAARIRLVEASPLLRELQGKALAGFDVAWLDEFAAAADVAEPILALANEFFDALPVCQIERTAAGWRERLVSFEASSGRFGLVTAADETPVCALVPERLRQAPPGAVFEVSPAARELAGRIAQRVVRHGGACLVIDYGHSAHGLGDTLQAVRRHRRHDPLADPGSSDITAHVDFESLGEAARAQGAAVFGPVPQGLFLRRLGIEARAAALGRRAARARDIAAAVHRLVGSAEMGVLFKALAVAAPGSPPPPGFEDQREDGRC